MSKEERVEIAKIADTEGWFDGKKVIPFSEMDDEYLQNAKLHAQRKELYYHNRYTLFSDLVWKMDQEAEHRGIQLRDYNTEYHRNYRKAEQLKRLDRNDVQLEAADLPIFTRIGEDKEYVSTTAVGSRPGSTPALHSK